VRAFRSVCLDVSAAALKLFFSSPGLSRRRWRPNPRRRIAPVVRGLPPLPGGVDQVRRRASRPNVRFFPPPVPLNVSSRFSAPVTRVQGLPLLKLKLSHGDNVPRRSLTLFFPGRSFSRPSRAAKDPSEGDDEDSPESAVWTLFSFPFPLPPRR